MQRMVSGLFPSQRIRGPTGQETQGNHRTNQPPPGPPHHCFTGHTPSASFCGWKPAHFWGSYFASFEVLAQAVEVRQSPIPHTPVRKSDTLRAVVAMRPGLGGCCWGRRGGAPRLASPSRLRSPACVCPLAVATSKFRGPS